MMKKKYFIAHNNDDVYKDMHILQVATSKKIIFM